MLEFPAVPYACRGVVTAFGRELRRERLDPRYPELDLWYDAWTRLEDLRLPDPAAPAYPLCRWAELEGPLTYATEESEPRHLRLGDHRVVSLACRCPDCCRLSLAGAFRRVGTPAPSVYYPFLETGGRAR